MVVLVAGVVELHNLRIALGLVVDHFLAWLSRYPA